jgi:hypothetical protein
VKRLLALGMVTLAGCTSSVANGPSKPTPPSDCALAATHDAQPRAVLRDVAGGPTEFMVGVPGDHLTVRKIESIVGLPRLAGGRLYFSKLLPGGHEVEVRSQALDGSCPKSLGTGQVQAVSLDGREVLIASQGKYRFVDATGKLLAELPPASYTVANNGMLVKVDGRGLTVYDRQGKKPKLLKAGAFTVLGAIGPESILVSDVSGTEMIDVAKQTSAQVGGRRLFIASGSPDGKWIASSDLSGVPQLIKVADSSTTTLPRSGPVTGFIWSEDSANIAVQALFGGQVWNVAAAKPTDLGPFVVASW